MSVARIRNTSPQLNSHRDRPNRSITNTTESLPNTEFITAKEYLNHHTQNSTISQTHHIITNMDTDDNKADIISSKDLTPGDTTNSSQQQKAKSTVSVVLQPPKPKPPAIDDSITDLQEFVKAKRDRIYMEQRSNGQCTKQIFEITSKTACYYHKSMKQCNFHRHFPSYMRFCDDFESTTLDLDYKGSTISTRMTLTCDAFANKIRDKDDVQSLISWLISKDDSGIFQNILPGEFEATIHPIQTENPITILFNISLYKKYH